MLIDIGQIVSQIKPIPLGIKNPALTHVKSFRRQVSILMKSPQDQIPAFFDVSFQRQNYRIFINDDVTSFKCKQHGHIQRKCLMNKTNKPDNTVNDLHKTDNHSEKVYEAEALQTAFSHYGSNTENLVTFNSTPSSVVSTAEPKLTTQTEDVTDKAATSVSVVQFTDSLSTTTTVAEVHKSAETESNSSKVNNTESQSDPTQSTIDHPSVSTESNVSVIAKTVEMCINTPKHTIKRKADTSDVQLKSAKLTVSSKQTENSDKIVSVSMGFTPVILCRTM